MADKGRSGKTLGGSAGGPLEIVFPSHGEVLSESLWKFFQQKHGTDFDFRFGEASVPAHRLILEVFMTPEKLVDFGYGGPAPIFPSPDKLVPDFTSLEKLAMGASVATPIYTSSSYTSLGSVGQGYPSPDKMHMGYPSPEKMHQGFPSLHKYHMEGHQTQDYHLHHQNQAPGLTVPDNMLGNCPVQQLDPVTVSGTGESVKLHLDLLFQFLYTGKVSVERDQLNRLAEVSKELDLQVLTDAIELARKAAERPGSSRIKNFRTWRVALGRRSAFSSKLQSAGKRLWEGNNSNKKRPEPLAKKTTRGSTAAAAAAAAAAASAKPGTSGGKGTGYDSFESESDTVESKASESDCSDPDVAPKRKNTSAKAKAKAKTAKAEEPDKASSDKPAAAPRRRLHRIQPPLLKCRHCSFKSRSETRYEIHQADHDPSVVVYKCETCEKKFLSEALLGRHQSAHTGIWYRCEHDGCDYKTNEKSRYQVHQAKHDPTVTIIRCSFCPKRFTDQESLGRHKCVRMGGTNLLRCPHCEYTTPHRARYQIHQAKHDPSIVIYRCVCDRPFLNAESLKNHRCKLGGPDAELFRCPHCKYTNKFAHQLKYHVLAMHRPGEKPYKCPQIGCGYATGRKKDVGRHYNSAHLNIRPFMCDTCGHRSLSRSKLQAHNLTHTGEKPYKCDMCEQAFSNSTSLKRHRERHVSDERPYVCHVCGRAFNRRSNLNAHLKNVHKTPTMYQGPFLYNPELGGGGANVGVGLGLGLGGGLKS